MEKLPQDDVMAQAARAVAVDSGFPKAETLAFRPGMYRLASPPAGVDPDIVDTLRDPVE